MQVTVVWPAAKTLPDAGAQVTATSPSMLSVAEAANSTVAPAVVAATATISAGRLSAGGVRSAADVVAETSPLGSLTTVFWLSACASVTASTTK